MPIINIQVLEGRTPAQKKDLVRELAGAVTRTLNVPEEAIRIIVTEVAPEHWGVGARTMAEIRNQSSA